MRTKGANGMGRFSVEFEIANYDDLLLAKAGYLEPDKVRRQKFRGLVDPGASKLVLPESLVKKLGLSVRGKINVRYADGRRAQRREADGAYVEFLGRHDTFS